MQRQTTHADAAVTRWLQNTARYSGFVFCDRGAMALESSPDPKIKYDPQEKPREWEFRIAVLPHKDNLNMAAQALASVFSRPENAGIDFKCLFWNREAYAPEEWDGTLGFGSDRDQRGKEICVYMAYNPQTDTYQRTPAQWKELMLSCWKALLDAGVQGIGYAACPTGDKSVTAEIGLTTPFTYTAWKPYTNRHGILHQDYYNPLNHKNPLQDVIFTLNDLARSGIPLSHLRAMEQERLQYLRQHAAEALTNIESGIAQLRNDGISFQDMGDSLMSLENDAQKKLLPVILNRIPRTSNGRFEQAHLAAEIENYINSNKQERLAQAIERLIEFNCKERPALVDAIRQDYMGNTGIMKQLQVWGINGEILHKLIEMHTVPMQSYYRRLVHVLHELDVLPQEQDRVINHDVLALLDIIRDSGFWKSHYKTTQAPKCILALQQAMSGRINRYPLYEDLKTLFAEFGMIVNRYQSGPSGMLSGLFAAIKPDAASKLLSQVFMEAKEQPCMLHKSGAFATLMADWMRFGSEHKQGHKAKP